MRIFEAAQEGGFNHLEMAIKKNIDIKNTEGQTPLNFAISKGDLQLVKELINSGANLHITNDESEKTPLEMAVFVGIDDTYEPRDCSENELEIIREVMEGLFQELEKDNANINKGDRYGITLLHYAVGYSNAEFVKKLIKIGADVKVEDHGRYTPLMLAAQFNDDPEVVKKLIANGAIVKKQRTMLIHHLVLL